MPRDAVTVAPRVYKVVLENERVRVLEARGKPGDKTELHAHPAQVVIAITDGKFRFTAPDGQAIEAELKAGQVMYLDPVEHTTEITGTTESHNLLVELK
jgi:quercetin dioxygenase-like cupin family protein